MSVLESNERPLVTFAVIAYNQERYIREAIAAGLAQTYSPLEIILSDDCSSDGTFAIMRALAAEYTGPHRIRLNRNETNAGIGGHCQKIFGLMQGDYVILAAGDDVSLPSRAETLMSHFLTSRRVTAVFSNINLIDETSTVIELNKESHLAGDDPPRLRKLAENGGGVGLGATYAYAKPCLFWPAPYPGHLMNEDRILPFRAAILGDVVHVPEGLVSYRLTKEGVSRSLSKKALWVTRKAAHIKELKTTIAQARRECRLGLRETTAVNITLSILSIKGRLLNAQEDSRYSISRLAYKALVRAADFLLYRRGRLQRIRGRLFGPQRNKQVE